MPRERIPLIRKGGFADAEKLFVLSFEGSKSEKKYFEDFRVSELFNDNGLIETIPLKRDKKSGTDPISVKKLLKKAKDEFPFKKSDEFWLIIDRDDWETSHKQNFSELVEDCKAENNFFLAMSNPCFEIWLILHLKDVQEFSQDERYKILKNAKYNKTKNYIDIVLGDLIQTGRGYNKIPNPLIFLHRDRIEKAIARAHALDTANEDYPSDIGSHVYRLVKKLLKSIEPDTLNT
jgi:hypothetical protein